MRRRARGVSVGLGLAMLSVALPAWAVDVAVRAAAHPDYARIVFDWPKSVGFQAEVRDNRLVVTFAETIKIKPETVTRALGDFVSGGRIRPDEKGVEFDLRKPMAASSFRNGNSIVVDLKPAPSTPPAAAKPAETPTPAAAPPPAKSVETAPPAAPAAVKPGPAVPVVLRLGEYPDHSRLVFDWPAGAATRIERNGSDAVLRFDRPGRLDAKALSGSKPRFAPGLTAEVGPDGALAVRAAIPADADVKISRSGNSVVVDVMKPGTRVPPPAAKSPTPPTEVATTNGARAATPPAVNGPSPSTAPAPAAAISGAPDAAPPAASAPEAVKATAPADLPTIQFDAGGPAAVAIFARAGRLYFAFDRPMPLGAGKVSGKGVDTVGGVEPVPATGGSVFRTKVGPFIWPKVTREGTMWRVQPSNVLAAPPGEGVRVDADPDFLLGGRLVVRAPDAGTVVQFVDPDVGDRLIAVPLPNPGDANPMRRTFPQVELPVSFQGLVVRPIGDDVTVRPIREGVEISAAGGLALSPNADRSMGKPRAPGTEASTPPAPAAGQSTRPAPTNGRQATAPPPKRTLNFTEWQRGGLERYTDNRQSLQQAIADAPPEAKAKAALDLAKFFLSFGMGQEAAGVLQALEVDNADASGWPDFKTLRGIARYFAGDHPGAEADLSDPSLARDAETAPWRAAVAAAKGDWDSARKGFQAGTAYLGTYPDPLMSRMSLVAADAASRGGDLNTAQRLIDRALARGGPDAEDNPAIRFARGELYRRNEETDRAREQYQALVDGSDRYYGTRAQLALIEMGLADKSMSPKVAADILDGLTLAWRGDALEIEIRKRLGETKVAAGEYADGFNSLKDLIATLGAGPEGDRIASDMRKAFADLFTDGAAKLSTLDALKLYDQFRELTPLGEDGDAMIRALAERLVKVDLLDRAADLYEHQVKYRLSGQDKARIGTRLASIRLLDAKPDAAIQALQDSNVPGIPDDLRRERDAMLAKALAEQGRTEEALRLLSKDDSRPADLLRVDIAWRSQKWDEAAVALGKVIGPPPADGKIPPEASKLVLNRAVALALSGDATGLNMLRKDFGPSMTTGPDADTFSVLTRPEQATGLIDINTIRTRVAEVDMFKNFLKGYRNDKTPGGKTPPAPATPGKPAVPPT